MGWVPLPVGSAISTQAGAAYAVVASIKSSHTQSDITSIAKGKGLNVYSFEDLGADGSDYRFVRVAATAVSSGSIPWSAPWPLSLLDGSHITQAWVDVKPTSNEATPGDLPFVGAGVPLAAWIFGAAALGAGGWYAYRRWWHR